jgi:hypothetical protein
MPRFVLILIPALLLASVVASGVSGQEEPTEDLAARLARIEKSLKEATETNLKQDEHIKLLERRLVVAEQWMQTLPGTMTRLRKTLDDVHALGFTYAGTNTKAREALLNALRTLSQELTAAIPAPEKR